jgi:hypothetical protein
MERSWSVREAAERLLCSEATIRRRVTSGDDLEREPGPGPLRITGKSLAAAQADMLRRMGVQDPDAQDTNQEQARPGKDEEMELLRAEVRRLQGALADLTAAHSAVLDTFRRLSSDAIPNR